MSFDKMSHQYFHNLEANVMQCDPMCIAHSQEVIVIATDIVTGFTILFKYTHYLMI